MRWKYLVSITLLAYIASQAVFAQPTTGSNGQTSDNTAQPADQNQAPVVDSGGNLQVAPEAPLNSGVAQPQQSQQPAPDSVNVAPGSQGEGQMPSNQNEGTVPETPSQDSMPATEPGSMQN